MDSQFIIDEVVFLGDQLRRIADALGTDLCIIQQPGLHAALVTDQSGYHWGTRNVLPAGQIVPAGYNIVFRVEAVPEPSSSTYPLWAWVPCLACCGGEYETEIVWTIILRVVLSLFAPRCGSAFSRKTWPLSIMQSRQLSNASQGVALYYAQARGIPQANLIPLQIRCHRNGCIAYPIRERNRHSDLERHQRSGLRRGDISVIVLAYGVPSFKSRPSTGFERRRPGDQRGFRIDASGKPGASNVASLLLAAIAQPILQ